ncbi:uncharacterized protein BB_0063-like [Ylistrum balloti]|uniref:uncharacterized protein BB_0063-like n=1 Tax=Ylistrum balloti TaxID=509963 RepID=UPI002905E0F3|nr:uncharacterized protein BB_0063-like [Ylistrum balloti]
MQLVEGILELQQRNLLVKISEQSSSTSKIQREILSQDPKPGISVRENRMIQLVVDKGKQVQAIPRLLGKTLTDIRENTVVSSDGLDTYFSIGYISKMFDESPVGTVLGQYPPQGTKLGNEFVTMRVVVSRGSGTFEESMPDMLGLPFEDFFPIIEAHSPSFIFYFVEDTQFILETETEGDTLIAGLILEQVPVPDESIISSNTMYIGIRENMVLNQELSEEEAEALDTTEYRRVGIMELPLTEYEYDHEITIYITPASTSGVRAIKRQYLKFLSRGGNIAIPYYIQPGDKYTVERFGIEVWSRTIPNNT